MLQKTFGHNYVKLIMIRYVIALIAYVNYERRGNKGRIKKGNGLKGWG
jgi:hypothetical protein